MGIDREPVDILTPRRVPAENKAMGTTEHSTVPPEILADMQAVADHIASGTPLDSAVVRRISERSRQAQAELVRQYGVRESAVGLIREVRDEE